MSTLIRERLPTLLVAVCGFIILANYYYKNDYLGAASSTLVNWATLLSAFAMGVVTLSMIIFSFRGLMKRENLLINGIQFTFTTGTVLIGILMGATSSAYVFLSTYILTPTLSAIGSMILFFIVTAIIRTFKLKSIETVIIVMGFSLVVLGNAPMGAAIWSQFSVIGPWLISGPQMAIQRGFLIGATIGSIVLGIRTLLGYERSWSRE